MKRNRLLCAVMTLTLLMQGCAGTDIVGTAVDEDKIHISMSFWEPGAKNELKNAFAEIVNDYKTVRPDVEIELLVQPVQRYSSWIMERQSESNLPTIMYNEKANIIKMDKSGLIYHLDKVLEAPNEYQENTVWKEIFDEEKLNYTVDLEGKLGLAIPLSSLGLAVYYNKDIYRENGLSVPKTWNEFLGNCAVIEKNGINPIAFMAQKKDAVNWLQWAICTNAFGKRFLGDGKINIDGNNVISQFEMANSVASGAYDVTVEPYKSTYREYLVMVQQFAKYAHDSIGLDEDGAKEQFINGRAAHIFTGSWEMTNLLKNDKLEFEAGVVPFPAFTEENTAYGGEQLTIRTTTCLAVTKMQGETETTPEQEAAVDFLKFLTSKKEYSKYAANTGTIPTVKGIESESDWKSFEGTASAIEMFSIGNYDGSYAVTMRAIAGDIDLDDNAVYAEAQKGNMNFADNYFSQRPQ
ncbi:MAG: extracellular solute-binding protein [Clostridia bacterium]|nr:extracellular solute-binding protein [Clostridia bacterium]